MDNSFRLFLDAFLVSWQSSSLSRMKVLISSDYKAREIRNGDIVDFGYYESIRGWEQGFNFVLENQGQWKLKELAVLPLRAEETMVIVSATIVIEGKTIENANLFFNTFKKNGNNNWELVRSYIEAGIPNVNLNKTYITNGAG